MRFRSWVNATLLSAPLFGALTASAQYSAPVTPAPYNPTALGEVTGAARETVQSGQRNYQSPSQSPYLGGVPEGKSNTTPVKLSLKDAVALGLKHNLGGVLATDVVTDARGQRWQALSEMLPNVLTDTGFGVRQINVKATLGITIPGQPRIIGPFGYFDSRAYVTQSLFDWSFIERARSSNAQLKAAELSSKDARELVVLVIVSNYLLAIADQSEVESATSQRDTAKALLQQTSDQETAGLASAVDVLRSQLQVQSRQQKLIVAQNNLAKEKLALARAIGLPSGQQFQITSAIGYQELSTSSLEEAIESAYKTRADYQSQINLVRSAELNRKAAAAERYPSISAEADYGLLGVNPGSSHGTVNAAGTLRIPLFQGGRVHGDVLRADASLTEAKERLEDLRARIDQEVRDAYLDLQASAQEVSVEKSAVALATQNLEQSRDRFASGVTDNLEVVQAQDALAIADDAYIASVYGHNLAKISLARATGVTESRFAEYVEGK
ncbi:MAG TPA: TolC family protein [Terracidiphilus sp.]|jgi:outer membrane protein TolC